LLHCRNDLGVAACDMAEQDVGMTVRRLCIGRHYHVGAVFEGALAEWRHRCVVDYENAPAGMDRFRHRGDVANIQSRIGRRLGIYKPVTFKTSIQNGSGRARVDMDAEGSKALDDKTSCGVAVR